MNKKVFLISSVIIILVIAVMGFKKYYSTPIQSQTRFLMDTYCTIQVPGNKEVLKAIEKAFIRIEEIDIKFNPLNPESPIYDFNNNNIPIYDEEIIALIETALDLCETSGGSLDITVFPLIDLWGFFGETPDLPQQKKINEMLKLVGSNNIAIEDSKLVKYNDKIKIDLGAIAKGYALGEAIKVLKKAGIKSALVDAGGDIYALGKISGRPWKIGIQNPRGDGVIGTLELSDMAVVTSGDYERYFEKDGIRYHHILDPRTGHSAKGMASVTVISKDPVFADAWSTALFVMGQEKGLEIMEKDKSFEALMITDKGEKIYSSKIQVDTIKIGKEVD